MEPVKYEWGLLKYLMCLSFIVGPNGFQHIVQKWSPLVWNRERNQDSFIFSCLVLDLVELDKLDKFT